MMVASFLVAALVCCHVAVSIGHFSAKDPTEDGDQNQVGGSVPPPISDHRFFLHEIFTKYGRGGQMTFEGFEHLLESLGLGNIIINDHNMKDHKEGELQNLHGTHDHSKKSDHDHTDVTPERDPTPTHRHEIQKHVHTHPTQATSPTAPLPPSDHHLHQNALPTTHADYHHVTVINDSGPSSGKDHHHTPEESVFHYRLREVVKIPELLINISTLVEQHNEMEDRVPGFAIEQCLSPREILATFGINQTSSLNPVSFLHLCPAIIYELDQGHCMLRDSSHKSSRSITTLNQWLYSSLAVIVISLCGLLSVAVIPIMQKWFYHTLLQFFVGLAVGSLSGDALLHLMPHAMLGGEGSHDHNGPVSTVAAEKMAVWRGFAALVGIFFFFLAERFLGNYASYRKQKKERKATRPPREHNGVLPNDVSLAGSVGEKLSQYRKSSYRIETSEKEMINMLNADTLSSRKASVESLPGLELNFQKQATFSLGPIGLSPAPSPPVAVLVPENRGHGHGHSHEVPDSVTAVAWMVIMGDGLHNFCDGLAIGAAFASGLEGGISTTVAVFCHELPHELGDFAMLLKTGMTVKQAMLYNALSSVLCFVGMVIGVSLGNVESATSWVFAATAGMFLYIALVDMLPELSAPGDPDFPASYQLAVQMLGICFGVSIMLLIANFEQDLQNLIS